MHRSGSVRHDGGGRLERGRGSDDALKRGSPAWLHVSGGRDCAQIVVDDG